MLLEKNAKVRMIKIVDAFMFYSLRPLEVPANVWSHSNPQKIRDSILNVFPTLCTSSLVFILV